MTHVRSLGAVACAECLYICPRDNTVASNANTPAMYHTLSRSDHCGCAMQHEVCTHKGESWVNHCRIFASAYHIFLPHVLKLSIQALSELA